MSREKEPSAASPNARPRIRSRAGVAITAVEAASPAAEGGLASGGRLLSINGSPVRDELDLFFFTSDAELDVEFLHPDGSRAEASIAKGRDVALGIEVEPLRPRRCRNRCVFCFIDQNPPGLRSGLYFKDEDFRLSFTHGHYLTATDLGPADLDRIVEQRLSPLYISVHAARHDLRCRLLGVKPSRTPNLLKTLRFFATNRIAFHCQVVLCPNWNDGPELDRTLDDLESLGAACLSVAVVPVGLTSHRKGLEPLEAPTPEWARAVISQLAPRRQLASHQERFLAATGRWRVLLADEFYLLAGTGPPAYSEEEIDCQIENGVGMVASFWQGWDEARERLAQSPARSPTPSSVSEAGRKRVALLTGKLGEKVLQPLAAELNASKETEVRVVALENSLFGPSVTVSGLLPGGDLDRALAEFGDSVDLALLPANALRPEDERFLDDLTLSDLRARNPGVRIEAIAGGAVEILQACHSGPTP
jgi:putative radical SAM enzyme (TIGR03279 family)